MAFDLEEQEQLDELKAWWDRWGTLVSIAIAGALAATAGWQWWRNHQATQAAQAAVIFDRLDQAAEAGDDKVAREIGGMIIDKYAGTGYAPRAALILAGVNLSLNDSKSARAQLEWAIEHARDPGLKDLARLRLAAVLLDAKEYDAAMSQLNAAHSDAFAPRFNDLKGDVLMAEGKAQEAKAAYDAAYKALDEKNPLRQLVGFKLDALGGPAK
ncbi:MAG: tetratricopeptide repeat protein [Thiobacillaceae bacterium]